MTIVELCDVPSRALADSLADFEREFAYPLGESDSFHISHGDDYSRFYRAMGEHRTFIALRGDRVVGTVGVAIRDLTLADGSRHRSAYLGDVKIAASDRGGVVLHRVARVADPWIRARATSAFGVVMEGTAELPAAYTGRAGVPAFEEIGQLAILRYPTDVAAVDECLTLQAAQGMQRFLALCESVAFAAGGDASMRSEMTPQWIASRDGKAIGRLEDTRLAKRLLRRGGSELESAHLACFAAQTPSAAAEVIRAAQHRAASKFPALFVAIDRRDVAIVPTIDRVTIAGARIYGVNLAAAMRWSISSSEI